MGPQNKTIFVGNLSFSTTEEQLKDLFAAFGEVLSVHLVCRRETGESRGFAYIKMPRIEAEQAIAALDGDALDGRMMRISEAQPRHERQSAFAGKLR